MNRYVLNVFCLLLLLTGCTAGRIYEEEDPSLGWYPAKVERELTGTDPLEGWNRSMFFVTDAVMEYLGDPIERIYGSIMPRPAVEAIERLCLHVEYPGRLITTLGTAEWKGAWDETCRFFINTIVGLGGFFDPAGYWWHIYSTESDFGQMFAIWGIGPGCTFMLPFCPSTNVRDTVGFLFDCAFDVKTYLPYTYLATLNRFVVRQQQFSSVVEASADHYQTFRMMLALYRETQIKRWAYHKRDALWAEQKRLMPINGGEKGHLGPLPVQPGPRTPRPDGLKGQWVVQKEYFPQTGYLETMRQLLTRPKASDDYWFLPHTLFNRNFFRKLSVRKLKSGTDRYPARYGFFPQDPPKDKNLPPPPEKTAILLPGINGTYDASSTLALAEAYHENGYNVIALDSAFFWRSSASTGKLPGFVPSDAKRMRTFLQDVMADLKKDGLVKNPVSTVLTGWSYGAVCAAVIAEAESRENTLNLTRTVLLNPPVDFAYAMGTLDGALKDSAAWTPETLRAILPDTVGELLTASQIHLPVIRSDDRTAILKSSFIVPRIREDAARYLTAVTLRTSMRDMLYLKHKKTPLPTVRNTTNLACRNALFDELDRIGFERYAKEFLLPQLREEGIAADYTQLQHLAGLYPLENFLRTSPDIRVLHNWNDVLLSDRDRKWLDGILGQRITWFDAGGHLGNLYLQRVRDAVIEASGK